jgi:hypothetical protein
MPSTMNGSLVKAEPGGIENSFDDTLIALPPEGCRSPVPESCYQDTSSRSKPLCYACAFSRAFEAFLFPLFPLPCFCCWEDCAWPAEAPDCCPTTCTQDGTALREIGTVSWVSNTDFRGLSSTLLRIGSKIYSSTTISQSEEILSLAWPDASTDSSSTMLVRTSCKYWIARPCTYVFNTTI